MKGLVFGLMSAVLFTAAVFIFTILRVDWEEESKKAVERVTAERMEMDEKEGEEDGERKEEGRVGEKRVRWEEEEQKLAVNGGGEAEMAGHPNYLSVAINEEEKKELAISRLLQHVV